MEIRQCQVLVAVAETGGVVRAAKRLAIAQSTVSETLLALEREVGERLTIRDAGRRVRLTPSGELLLPFARELLAVAAAAVRALKNQNRSLRIGAVESVSSYLLPKVLGDLQSLATIQVSSGICEVLRQQVKEHLLDAAVVLRRPPSPKDEDKSLLTTDLGEATLVLIELSSAQADSGPRTAIELGARRLLLPDPEGALNELVTAWFAGSGAQPRIESAGSIDGVKRGVALGAAVGVIPRYAARSELASGVFHELKLMPPFPRLALQLITSSQEKAMWVAWLEGALRQAVASS